MQKDSIRRNYSAAKIKTCRSNVSMTTMLKQLYYTIIIQMKIANPNHIDEEQAFIRMICVD